MGFPGSPRTDLSEAIVDAVGSAVLVIDSEGYAIRWNPAAAALTGISADRIQGQVFQQILLFPDDINRWNGEISRILAGFSPRHFETRWKSQDGSPLSLTAFCSAIRAPAGHVQYVVCNVIGNLSRELMTDRTAEFRDMARFLHDTISQDLVALSYNVSYLETTALDQPARSHTGSALDLIDRCCRFIRVMTFMLAPPSPPETTLEASIEQYVDYVRQETGLTVITGGDPVPVTVSIAAQSLLFAAVQKWVAEGVRTRGKPAISIRLRNRGAGTVLEMERFVVASAAHTEPRSRPHHTGWTLIRERTRALGGKFDIAGDTTRVFARISLPD
jgi:PAS domain S-box-containing protein